MSTETASEAGPREKGPEEMFCSECGEIIRKRAEICPKCGVRTSTEDVDEKDSRIGKGGYLLIGAVSGLVALIFFPPVFGLISIICGVQLFRKYSELIGFAVMGWGGVSLILGVILGALLWA